MNIYSLTKMKVYLLTFSSLLGVATSASAQIDERFMGKWVLELAEVRESLFEKPGQVEKTTTYTLENAGRVPLHFDIITEMEFRQQKEAGCCDGNGNDPAAEDDFGYIETRYTQYQNPLLQVHADFLEISDRIRFQEMGYSQYEYTFITPEKLQLTSYEVFYLNDGVAMRAKTYLTLTRQNN